MSLNALTEESSSPVHTRPNSFISFRYRRTCLLGIQNSSVGCRKWRHKQLAASAMYGRAVLARCVSTSINCLYDIVSWYALLSFPFKSRPVCSGVIALLRSSVLKGFKAWLTMGSWYSLSLQLLPSTVIPKDHSSLCNKLISNLIICLKFIQTTALYKFPIRKISSTYTMKNMKSFFHSCGIKLDSCRSFRTSPTSRTCPDLLSDPSSPGAVYRAFYPACKQNLQFFWPRSL